MGTTETVVVALLALLVLLSLRTPVAFALFGSGTLGLVLLRGFTFTEGTLGRIPFQTPARYALVIIPLFIAMGVFAKHGTLAQDAFDLLKPKLRKLPGGLGVATIGTCSGFAAVSGSSVATVATVGPIAIREMRSEGYDTSLASGLVATAGTLGVLIPPSIALVLYGIVSGESIGTLLIAGVVPGVLSALGYTAAIMLKVAIRPEAGGRPPRGAEQAPPTRDLSAAAARNPSRKVDDDADAPVDDDAAATSPDRGRTGGDQPGPSAPAPQSARGKALSVSRVILLFVVIVGGIYFGVVTATEAAAVGGFLALVFMLVDAWRDRPGIWRTIADALGEAIRLTSMVFALLIGAAIFTFFLVTAGVPSAFTNWVAELGVAPWLIVLLLLLALIPLGMFLDPISMLLIAVPLSHPVVTELGFDGIWFGVLVVKMVELALVTPPVGINGYVVAGAAEGVEVGQVFRGIMWFFIFDAVIIALLFAVPGLVTWLPALVGMT